MFRRDFLVAGSVVLASTSAFGGATGTAVPQRKLMVFNSVSLDGYFTDGTPDVNWAHARDDEWQKFTRENAGGDAELIFGRKTYEMMAGFWPTPEARQRLPDVAASMHNPNRIRPTCAPRRRSVPAKQSVSCAPSRWRPPGRETRQP